MYVLLAAAKVGGILANEAYPAEFIRSNLVVQTNVIHESWRNGVRRLLFLGSSCIYLRQCPQPIREDFLLTGPLETTNRAYALTKIAGLEMRSSYNKQYGTKFLGVMPTNLYGPGDNYDLRSSHVMPAIIRKCHEAKTSGANQIHLWGTGSPRREFLHSDDMADACLFLMELPDEQFSRVAVGDPQFPLISIGCGQDLTIKELAQLVKDIVGYTGDFAWDVSKPDGTPRKLLDVGKIRSLGWQPRIGMREGIIATYREFLKAGIHAD